MSHAPKHALKILLATTWMAGVGLAQPAKEIPVASLASSVVQTVPQFGDTAVDPALKEIRVTFSKDMITNRLWSVLQISKESFPETAGQFLYLPDKRTCVIPVKSKPGKPYGLWFNPKNRSWD